MAENKKDAAPISLPPIKGATSPPKSRSESLGSIVSDQEWN